MSYEYSEDQLIEQATEDVLKELGWTVVTAWQNETFGELGLLGRDNKTEVVLERDLYAALKKYNPHLPEQAYKKAVELLEEVGITNAEKRMKNYPHQLSGGMRQRVVIAIALSCDPYVLICDEPTTALDVTIQAKILELIQDLQKKKGISVIYITHDLGVVAKVADFVNVMYAGKIVETGSIEDIFYRPLHPYTWGLLSAMPDLNTDDPELYTIPGSPPNVTKEIKGDAFAPRNKYALNIDKRIEPPMFKVEGSTTHKVASWLMHPNAPKVEMPEALRKRIDNMMKEGVPNNGQE